MTGSLPDLAAQPITLLDLATLRSVVEDSTDCIKVLDLDARLLSINAGGMQVMEIEDFGVCANLLWPDFWTGESRALVEAALVSARAGERSRFEAQGDTFRGSSRWWAVNVAPIYGSGVHSSEVVQILAISRDITERKRAGQALQDLNVSLDAQVRQRTAQLEDQSRAQDAFIAFAEAVSIHTDVKALAQQAVQVIGAYLPMASAGYYVRTDADPDANPDANPDTDPDTELGAAAAEHWELRVAGEGVFNERAASDRSAHDRPAYDRPAHDRAPGTDLPLTLSAEHPVIAPVVQTLEPVFYDHWASISGRLNPETVYGAAAGVPLVLGGKVEGVLVVALQHADVLSGRDRALLRSVGRSLQLALERTELARQVLEAARAQQAFVAFTEAAGSQTELRALAAQAIEVMQTFIPGLSASLAVREPGSHPLSTQMLSTRQPVFADGWSASPEHAAASSGLSRAVAAYPLSTGGQVEWTLSAELRGARRWSEAERAVIGAVGRGLQLAIDRAGHRAELEKRNQELIRQQTFLDAVLQSMSESVAACDASGQLMLLSDGVQTHYGLEEASRAGAEWSANNVMFEPDGLTPMPLERIPLMRAWRGEPLQDAAFVVRAKGGAAHEFLASGQPMYAPDGQLFGAVITTRDVSARKAAEREQYASNERLALLNAELRAANEELEAFAYSASHDLRTPVRHVQSFSELTRRALEQSPNPAAARYLGFVEQAAVRMSTLIDSLLLLSRSSSQELRVQPVKLSELLERARQDAELERSGQRVEWVIAPLPVVNADPALLLQVLSNLIANAVKFSRTREVARIEVWAEEDAAGCSVFVRDNGVGFDPAYSARLFGVFQRLHSDHEFEGTGVGLATVRRIVLRHGGGVSAHSVLGEGATFAFTLPTRG